MSTCGPPCHALKSAAYRNFHLMKLAEEAKPTAEQCPDWHLYERSHGRDPEVAKRSTAAPCASHLLDHPDMIAALAWHRDKEAKKMLVDRDRIGKKLLETLETEPREDPSHGERVQAARTLAQMYGLNAPTKVKLENLADVFDALGLTEEERADAEKLVAGEEPE